MSRAFPIPSLTPDLLPLQAIKKERTGKVRSSFSVGAIKGSVLQDQFPYSPDDIRCPQAHQLAQLGLGTVFHEGIADTQTADALAAQQTVIGPAFQHGRGKTACQAAFFHKNDTVERAGDLGQLRRRQRQR